MVLMVPLSWELVHCLGPHCSSVKHTRIKNKQRMANLFTISYSSWFNYILKVNRGKKWSALSDKRSKKSDTQQREETRGWSYLVLVIRLGDWSLGGRWRCS